MSENEPAPLTPEQVAEGLRLDAARTPGHWRLCQGSTHLELRAPHQTERSVARVYCDIDAALISHAADCYGAALRQLQAQAAELAAAGVAFDTERRFRLDAERLTHDQAEELSRLRAERDAAHALATRLAEALTPFAGGAASCEGEDDHNWVPHTTTAGDYRRAAVALAEARAAGLVPGKEGGA